jgi:hypothetical protein
MATVRRGAQATCRSPPDTTSRAHHDVHLSSAFSVEGRKRKPCDKQPNPKMRTLSELHHPWIPTHGPDAVTIRGFVYDVDTGKLEEVSSPGPMGCIGYIVNRAFVMSSWEGCDHTVQS